MKIFRHKLNFRNFILIFSQLIIIKLSFATSVDSIVSNSQPAVSSAISSLSETLEFSDSIPGFEQHEFQSQRIKPLNTDKLNYNNKSNTITKVTTSATLAATLLKKIGLPSSSSTPKYNLSNNNKTILNSVLIKRTNRPTTATLISSNNNLPTTTPVTFDENDVLKRQFHKLSSTNSNKILRLSKKKKAKQSIYKPVSTSSSLATTTTTISPLLNDIDDENELKSSSLAPNNAIATEQHSVIINHGAGAVSTIRRTLNSNRQPSYEHVQIGYPPVQNNNPFGNDMFSNFPNIIDLTPPPIPQPIIKDENLNNNHNNYNLNQQPPSQPNLQPPPPPPPKIIQTSPPPLSHNDQTLPPIYSTNRNGRRGAHKKLLRKSALIKENNDLNQIVPVSVGIPNTFQNVKPAELPNFAELSFFGYRNEQNAPRSFNEREHYNTNNNFDKPPSTTFNHDNNLPRLNNNNQYNTAINQSPPPPPPPQDFNFNIHPFFSNERRNQPNNNDMYQFFDSPFIPMNNPPPTIHNLNNIHSHMHHGEVNPWIHHSNNINQPNTQNNQFFQRRKLTLNNGNQLNEISNNNLGYGYSSYNAYKGDEEAGIKWPKIFKFTDGRVNLNDFEKEKKLGKIEFGKSVAEDGNEYTFEHVRRDLFLILHGGSFN